MSNLTKHGFRHAGQTLLLPQQAILATHNCEGCALKSWSFVTHFVFHHMLSKRDGAVIAGLLLALS